MSTGIVLAGGGTAGHLFPSLAVAEQLQQISPDVPILLIGAAGADLDCRLLPQTQLPYHLIDARPFPYGASLGWVGSLWRLAASTLASARLLRRWRPAVIFAAGGYVAAPVVVAGRMLGIPSVVHICDAYPDRASRLLGRWADQITLTFAEASKYLADDRIVHTGGPVRRQILTATATEGRQLLKLAADKFTVLITGGSQGARQINKALMAALPALLAQEDLQIVHLTGQRDYETVSHEAQQMGARPPAYQCHGYLEQMGPAMAAADLIVSRAGSSSLAEATALGKPLILIPYPYAADHQKYNATAVQEAGAAEVIEDAGLTGPVLADAILELYSNVQRRRAQAEAAQRWGTGDAAPQIARLLLSYSQQ